MASFRHEPSAAADEAAAYYKVGEFGTDANSAPSFFGVTPGQNDVVGTVVATSETFAETTVTTVAGELTYVFLPPTPLN